MARGSERADANEARQVRAVLDVLGTRVRAAEGEVAAAREGLTEAERYRDVCERDFDAENARLQAIIAHLGRPEVAASAPRYAETLAMRDIVSRDLGRERFMLENAVNALDAARAALAERRGELGRLRARIDALQERSSELGKTREERRALAAEDEAEELATLRRARPVGAVA